MIKVHINQKMGGSGRVRICQRSTIFLAHRQWKWSRRISWLKASMIKRPSPWARRCLACFSPCTVFVISINNLLAFWVGTMLILYPHVPWNEQYLPPKNHPVMLVTAPAPWFAYGIHGSNLFFFPLPWGIIPDSRVLPVTIPVTISSFEFVGWSSKQANPQGGAPVH